MKRNAGILALVLVVSLLCASDVRGFALAPAMKTTGPALTATIVTDVTDPSAGKGLTSIRVQKASSSAAVLFAGWVPVALTSWNSDCTTALSSDLQKSTNFFFAPGLHGGLLGASMPESARNALLITFGTPDKSVITDTDYATCTILADGRRMLSFTAVIQFEP